MRQKLPQLDWKGLRLSSTLVSELSSGSVESVRLVTHEYTLKGYEGDGCHKKQL